MEGVNPAPQPANIQTVQDPATVQATQPVKVLPPPGPVELDPDEVDEESEEEEGDDEVFVSDVEDTTDEKAITPRTFSGTASEDGDTWMIHFQYYCDFIVYGDARQLSLFKVMLAGNAALWFDSLGEVTTVVDAKAEFDGRYKMPDKIKYKSAKEIFSRRQREDESADD